MDFSKFFIDRPIFAVVLSIIMFAVGLVAIPQLPVGEYPEVVPPSVVLGVSTAKCSIGAVDPSGIFPDCGCCHTSTDPVNPMSS